MRSLFAMFVLLPPFAFAAIVSVSGSASTNVSVTSGFAGSCSIVNVGGNAVLRVFVGRTSSYETKDISVGLPYSRVQDVGLPYAVNVSSFSDGCSWRSCCSTTYCPASATKYGGYSARNQCAGVGITTSACAPVMDNSTCSDFQTCSNPNLYWLVESRTIYLPITIQVDCALSFNAVSLDCNGADKGTMVCPESPACTDTQIATLDSAYYTGTYANPPRYELFKLPSSCPKTVISAAGGSSPAIDNNNQLNVAVSLDRNGNFISEGWSNNYTQAIFVSAEQTQEQLGCTSTDDDGYFVFCSSVGPDDPPPTHTVCAAEPCPNPDPDPDFVFGSSSSRPPDTTTTFVPPGGGGGGSSSSGDGIANLTKWEDMLRRVIPQSIPNPIPILTKIYDKLVEFKDFVVELFEPQDDPPTPNDDLYNVDDPTGEFEFEQPKEIEVDTIMKYDSLPMEDEDIFPDLEDEFRKKLDSIKTPDKDSIKNELIKKQENQLSETFDKIVDKVNKAVEPVRQALPRGDGACNCLADSFMNLTFRVMKGTVTVGSMIDTKIICDNISVIRRIIMVVVAVTCLGMILATLRR